MDQLSILQVEKAVKDFTSRPTVEELLTGVACKYDTTSSMENLLMILRDAVRRDSWFKLTYSCDVDIEVISLERYSPVQRRKFVDISIRRDSSGQFEAYRVADDYCVVESEHWY